jgi:uncharacterized membrane protein YciS (DUF1049 family)
LGFFLERAKPDLMMDFKGVYFDARCLLQHTDPYKPGEPLRVYLEEENTLPQSADGLRQVLMRDVYLPPASIFIAPFAMLPLRPAQVLWMILTAAGLVLAGYLIWNLGANYAPVISDGLICLALANSEVLFATGNPAGVAVSLCVVAVWCFLKDRFVWAGVVCLAISLAIKPHDTGLVWLYFLLAGGAYRIRALQTLLVTVVLGLAAIGWITPTSPHWMQELHSNLLADSAPGGVNNPGLASPNGRTVSMVIDLQSAVAVFRDDPLIYNSVSYIVCGMLLLTGAVRTLRSRFSQRGPLLALAAIAPLTMLVAYHRPFDAKLLLLAVPACAMLWAEGGRIGRLALLVTAAGIVATSDLPLLVFLAFTRNIPLSTAGLSGQMLTVALARPVPLILLVMGIFYLWIYLQCEPARSQP